MILKMIVDRIKTECPVFKKVEALTDINQIEKAATDTPAAFCFWGADQGAPLDGVGALKSQVVNRSIDVVIVGKVYRNGEEEIEDARTQLFAALVGWEATPDIQLSYSGGAPDNYNGAILYWRDQYEFDRYLRYVR